MMSQADRRRQVLLAWAYLQRQQGQAIPSNDELSRIAIARSVPPGLRTPVVNRWAHVLHHLMWLSDQGHPDPVKDALRMAPAGPPMNPRPMNPPPMNPRPMNPRPGSAPSVIPPSVTPPPDTAQPVRDRLSAQAKQAIEEINREIEQAAEAARQAVAQGREAGPHLIRRNTLRRRLAKLSRGEALSDQNAAEVPHVPPPPGITGGPGPAPVPTGQTYPEPRTDSEPRAPVESGLDPVQRLMVWRDGAGHDELKERHIRQIVNSGAHDVREVAAGLPASLQPLAPAIAAELGLDRRSGPAQQERSTQTGPGAADQPSGQVAEPAAGADSAPVPLNPTAVSWQQPVQLADELSRFTQMDFTEPPAQPLAMKVSLRADGNVTLRWAAAGGAASVTIYRVVSDDEHVPYSPDFSEVIGITTETSFTDARPFHSAVRHYQVWVNQGPTIDEAVLEQPRLHAGTPVVAKPVTVDIREDEGRVVGQWTIPGEARRVQIFRVPAERAGSPPGNPMYRICADQVNLTGFVDDSAEPGHRYLYQLLVEAEVEGVAQLSLPTVVPLTTSARLTAVPDLVCELHDHEGTPRFDLQWTAPPQGQVVIYRSAAAPLAGADAYTVDESALPQMNLHPQERLHYPSNVVAGRASVRDVPWPRDWQRSYFTPVTLLDGQARVGQTASAVHVDTPGDPRVTERVTEQVLTLGWPRGADTIKVFASSRTGTAEQAIAAGPAAAEISREQYKRLGGLHFSTPLDSHGCNLHLLPMAFSAGHAVYGKPATVAYRGLLKLRYTLEVRRGPSGRPPVLLVIRVAAEQANCSAPPFALVHNPRRLPLDVADGEQLQVRWNVEHPAQTTHRFRPPGLATSWSEPGWVADVTGLTGWVRVFIDSQFGPEHRTVALLDPPVAQLYLGGR